VSCTSSLHWSPARKALVANGRGALGERRRWGGEAARFGRGKEWNCRRWGAFVGGGVKPLR
jgi:hypothetical protein